MQTLKRRSVSLVELAGFDVEAVMIEASRSTVRNDQTTMSGWIATVNIMFHQFLITRHQG